MVESADEGRARRRQGVRDRAAGHPRRDGPDQHVRRGSRHRRTSATGGRAGCAAGRRRRAWRRRRSGLFAARGGDNAQTCWARMGWWSPRACGPCGLRRKTSPVSRRRQKHSAPGPATSSLDVRSPVLRIPAKRSSVSSPRWKERSRDHTHDRRPDTRCVSSGPRPSGTATSCSRAVATATRTCSARGSLRTLRSRRRWHGPRSPGCRRDSMSIWSRLRRSAASSSGSPSRRPWGSSSSSASARPGRWSSDGRSRSLQGSRVLVVEDVVTTGGSVAEVVDLVRDAGGEVVAIVSLIDRGGDKTFTDRFWPLLRLEVDSWEPASCGFVRGGRSSLFVPVVETSWLKGVGISAGQG